MSGLAETMFTAPDMAALFSPRAQVQRMLDVEAALARVQARAGMMPPEAAEAIASRCRVEQFDLAVLFGDAAAHATPVVPLVRMLTGLVDDGARQYVHWGATSQDIVDTATILQARDGLRVLERGLLEVAAACAALAERYRAAPMAGRTLLQQAVPITFGLKASRWLALATRLVRRLRRLRDETLTVQLGGAAGTLAALGGEGMRVMELLAAELGLQTPELPWHAERDRVAEIASVLGVTAGAMAKIATDLVLLAQTEVGEISAAPGAGGRSSAMPQKRNPVEAISAIACARAALAVVPAILSAAVQEHERAAGSWQMEWWATPELFRLTSGAVESVRRALTVLEVHPERMRANLESSGGLIMAEALLTALAPRLGRVEAGRLVEAASARASQERRDFREIVKAEKAISAVLTAEQLDRTLDPSGYLGSANVFIDRALSGYRALTTP